MASRIKGEHASHSQKPRDQLYSHLDAKCREIRLIELLPGSYDDYICCRMVVVSLDNEPEYKALSYTWGGPEITLPICVEGCILSSTLNLESALRQFRLRNEILTLWIDAICINQLDNEERTQQVTLMGDIYSQSKEVVIWLGKDLDSSTVGKEYLALHNLTPSGEHDGQGLFFWGGVDEEDDRELATAMTPFQKANYTVGRVRDVDGILLAFTVVSILANPKYGHGAYELPVFKISVMQEGLRVVDQNLRCIHALNALMHLPWWNRIWVVQEAILPRRATVFCGKLHAPWELFAKAANDFEQHQKACYRVALGHIGIEHLEMLQNFRIIIKEIEDIRQRRQSETLNLGVLLSTFRCRDAADPRDMIYGLLSLVTDWDETRCPRVIPDYQQSTVTVYKKAIVSMINDTWRLDSLAMKSRKCSIPGLPSWAPDWTVKPDFKELAIHREGRMSLFASTLGRGTLTLEQDGALLLGGCQTDLVTAVSAVMEDIEGAALIKTLEEWAAFLELPKQTGSSYIAGGNLYDAFWRTMFEDTFAEDGTDSGNLVYSAYRRTNPADKVAWEIWYDWYKSTVDSESKLVNHPQIPDSKATVLQVGFRVYISTQGRLLFKTKRGYIGLGPEHTQPGDAVFILEGSAVPLLLRLHQDQSPVIFTNLANQKVRVEKPCYELVGSSFILGMMDGEAMPQLDAEVVPIVLR